MSDAQNKNIPNNCPLDEAQICDLVRSCNDTEHVFADLLESVDVLQAVGSTNTYLLEGSIVAGRAKVCVAESQLAGRGRRGNDWQSAPNKNIIFSLSWGFRQWPATMTALGLAVGLVVAERIKSLYGIDIGIKWPNDLLVEGDKLAGILVDVAGDAEGGCKVVIGLGLNVHQPDWQAEATDYAWTDLSSHGIQVDRNRLIANIIQDCISMLVEFENNGFGPMVGRWNALSCYANKQVVLRENNSQEKIQGRMLGVDEMGALLIESEDKTQIVINNSQLSLRLAD